MPSRDEVEKEKERQATHEFRGFVFLCVPLGAIIAFFITLMADSGGVFLPAWGVCSLILFGVFSSVKREPRPDR